MVMWMMLDANGTKIRNLRYVVTFMGFFSGFSAGLRPRQFDPNKLTYSTGEGGASHEDEEAL
jgi:hypothetical protein